MVTIYIFTNENLNMTYIWNSRKAFQSGNANDRFAFSFVNFIFNCGILVMKFLNPLQNHGGRRCMCVQCALHSRR